MFLGELGKYDFMFDFVVLQRMGLHRRFWLPRWEL